MGISQEARVACDEHKISDRIKDTALRYNDRTGCRQRDNYIESFNGCTSEYWGQGQRNIESYINAIDDAIDDLDDVSYEEAIPLTPRQWRILTSSGN